MQRRRVDRRPLSSILRSSFGGMNETSPRLDDLRKREGLQPGTRPVWLSKLLKIAGITTIVLLLGGGFFVFKVLSAGKQIFEGDNRKPASLFENVKRLVGNDDRPLLGEEEGRTNILLLGIGGEGHSGQYLTDTMMVASIAYAPKDTKDQTSRVALLSLPRDLWVPVKSQRIEQKINSIYAYGEIEDGDGIGRLRPVIEEVLGIPIHYYVRADFAGFQQVVDDLGGVTVNVERSFTDYEYPTENYGYQTIRFQKGEQNMNGATALKYARSRHGIVARGEDGLEASDFARSRRQQLLLAAIREKALSIHTVLNPKKITDISGDLGDHIRTNLQPWEMLRLADIAKKTDMSNIINKVLDNGQNGLLHATILADGGYSLLPNVRGYVEIQAFARNLFESESIQKQEGARLAILNGTQITGLATATGRQLKSEGFDVVYTGNTTDQNTAQKSIIYSYTNRYDETIRLLRERFDVDVVTTLPDRSTLVPTEAPAVPDEAEIVVILGASYAQDHQPLP